jgi:acyl-CoA thioester hydrolase
MTNSPSSASSPNRRPLDPLVPPFEDVELRVRYSETDAMGVAHNKVYYEWFELGRTEYCRRQGLSYREIEERGIYLVVAESFCRYRKPLRYDDRFIVRTALRDIGPRKAVFAYEIRTLDGVGLVAQGYTVHVAVNRAGAVASMPEDVIARIGGR